mgnify:CR=1 FL=1
MTGLGQIAAAIGAWATRPLARLNLAFEARAARSAMEELGLVCASRGIDATRALGAAVGFARSGTLTREDLDMLLAVGLVALADGIATLTPLGRRVLAEVVT